MSKFLVLWSIEAVHINSHGVRAILEMPAYAVKLTSMGKLDKRYHVVGKHGGAWIYNVDSNEELDRLLAMAPVYNYAKYKVYALAEMSDLGTMASQLSQPDE